MNDDFLHFTWAWLPWATFNARGKVKTRGDATRFLTEAWDARTAGKAAATFGREWK
jgi:hypothetical protein